MKKLTAFESIKLFSFILFILISNFAYSQSQSTACGNDINNSNRNFVATCTQASPDYLNKYSLKEFHIPDETYSVRKQVHVNFNVWQDINGNGNLDNTPAIIARINQIFFQIQQNRYNSPSTVTSPPLGYSVQTIDPEIDIVLDAIYFYQDPTPGQTLHNSTSYGHNQQLDAYIALNHPERTKQLNIHLVRNSASLPFAGYSDFGSIETFYRTSPDMNNNPVHDWWFSAHVAHEIGHSFDLWHTYNVNWNQNCNPANVDFLTDVYDINVSSGPNPPYACAGCSVCINVVHANNNNLMGGSGGNEFHISALQSGIIHRTCALKNRYNVGYDMRSHVTGYSVVPYEVTTDETWDFSMKMYQDLVVKSGVTLTIQCELLFVPEAKVIVEPGAKLIIDGGTLTNEKYFNDFWQGIQVWGNSNQHQYPFNNPTHQGLIELKNDAVIENAREAITFWDPNNWGTMGGYIEASNSTFRNCRRAINFMSYHNFNPNTGAPTGNLSRISNCNFIIDDDYLAPLSDFYAHVSMWDVEGVIFRGCNFENRHSSRVFDNDHFGRGIFTMDAGFVVAGKCNVAVPYGGTCPEPNLNRSKFIGLNIGIEARSSMSRKTIKIDECFF